MNITTTDTNKYKLIIYDNAAYEYISAEDFFFQIADSTLNIAQEICDAIIIKHKTLTNESLKRIKEVRGISPSIPIIFIIDNIDDNLSKEAIRSGADDVFILSVDSTCRLKRSITYLCEKTKSFNASIYKPNRTSIKLVKQLTTREQEIVEELAKGKTNKDISKAVKLSPATVRNHLYEIFKKLNVSNRTSAVSIWLESQSSI